VRRRGAQIDDDTASAGRKLRLSAGADADLAFEVRAGNAGPRRLRVRYADIGFPAVPEVRINGRTLAGQDATGAKATAGWRVAEFDAVLQEGVNRIVLANGKRPLDYDYLEIAAVAP